ncbi:glycerophosphodiester phosphodiesterase [Arthrobacter sp. H14]|uniref:glycerophosphodiester phosphodiesterase n=1 Tax=Arthrobacter sp. H14 TaxID=1312959 RepID=UPI0004B79303|nr:glycerophosphodiester phosphodiesterase family protein [Arthrobacter sp. H14]
MRPVVYAHRGASGQFAEHTRAAYLQALAEGTDGVECDIHLSRDRELVLIHDHKLNRTSDGTGQVADYTLEELRRVDFHSWKGAEIPPGFGTPDDQFLTLLQLLEILRDYGKRIKLAIECKHPDPFGAELEANLFELLEAEGWDAQSCMLGNISFSFMSFDPDSVERLLAQVPARFVCQLLEDVKEAPIARALGLEDVVGSPELRKAQQKLAEGQQNLDAKRVGMAGPGIEYIRQHLEQVTGWVESGLTFRVWTVNSDDDVDLCIKLGIQEVTTDWPARTADRFAELAPPSA